MPRLRRISKEKYGYTTNQDLDFEDELPVDSDVQNEIIKEFKEKVDLSNSKYSKILFRIYLSVIVIVNMIFITVPYYRNGHNTIFSAFACLILFTPVIYTYNMIYPHNQIQVPILTEFKSIAILTVLYQFVTSMKLLKYREVNKFPQDLLFLVPVCMTICVLNLKQDNNNLKQLINKLESAKYEYKEA